MKKEKTIEFWDNYHAEEEIQQQSQIKVHTDQKQAGLSEVPWRGRSDSSSSSSSKEWILRDSPVLLKILRSTLNSIPEGSLLISALAKASIIHEGEGKEEELQQEETPIPRSSRRILEIGCGTSRLSRSFLEYLRYHANNNNNNNDEEKGPIVDFHVTATDASEVCLHINRARDCTFSPLLVSDHQRHDDSQQEPFMTSNSNNRIKDTLDYKVLDITKDNYNYNKSSSITTDDIRHSINASLLPLAQQDMILDKGCLDTLLFRHSTRDNSNITNNYSTQLHSHSRSQYPPVVTNLLNNVHSMLRPNGGIYLLITPRSKLKPVRDFQGFCSVRIQKISSSHVATAIDKTLSSNDCDYNTMEMGDLQHTTTTNNNNNKLQQKQCAYIYTCIRNDKYQICKHSPYVNNYNTATTLPPENDTCPKCHLSFFNFRSGENVIGKGSQSWIRRWKGHCLHCTG